ncbi:histone H3 [Chlamydia pneumoniae TW-183]|uniref:Conserved domain protein n=2 Tax=Chlamydia pneumoniae TaxID=83558 RepID=Q9K2C8_CHLPN|nr:hypothetical protein CP_0172 [Chlamydia pneumoniae AR39]AAP98529.1 histone H3 [Chlamydia pneumoniae TW-183]ACZ33554.1 conserved domain protein [Chlamydia pneumoniae LPCoLN]CRI33090.1 Conserved domain protein [Chlamydia pneumoniae]CRI35953.1 Conserved domain protein [Chlamydia pneumoniae]
MVTPSKGGKKRPELFIPTFLSLREVSRQNKKVEFSLPFLFRKRQGESLEKI